MELGQRIFFLARQKAMFLKQALREKDFKMIEFAIMVFLYHEPNSSQERIRDITTIDEASVARTVKKLEKNKLVTRSVNPENKRSNLVRLTEKGQQVTTEMQKVMDFWDDELLANLSKEKRAEFEILLDEILGDKKKLSVEYMLKEWEKRNYE